MPIPLVPVSVDARAVVVMVGADSPIAVTRGVARVSFERDSNPWDFLLVRTGDRTFTALSAVCTHFGCLVTLMTAEPIFVCPCHGSRYGHDGDVVRGPAIAPLRQLPTRYIDGVLTVTF